MITLYLLECGSLRCIIFCQNLFQSISKHYIKIVIFISDNYICLEEIRINNSRKICLFDIKD